MKYRLLSPLSPSPPQLPPSHFQMLNVSPLWNTRFTLFDPVNKFSMESKLRQNSVEPLFPRPPFRRPKTKEKQPIKQLRTNQRHRHRLLSHRHRIRLRQQIKNRPFILSLQHQKRPIDPRTNATLERPQANRTRTPPIIASPPFKTRKSLTMSSTMSWTPPASCCPLDRFMPYLQKFETALETR